MNTIKRVMGLIWMLLAPAFIYLMVRSAYINISGGGSKDINEPIPWIIIIAIFTPIAIGLVIFGFYAWKGEYDKLPESPENL